MLSLLQLPPKKAEKFQPFKGEEEILVATAPRRC